MDVTAEAAVAQRRLPQADPPVLSAKRLFGLDLVRAAAIAGVLVAHGAGASARLFGFEPTVWLYMGGHGVELFFALSGFLIGGLLIDIVEDTPGAQAWRVFMIRRWMRTVPLYVVCVLALLVIRPPADPGSTLISYLTFTQNLAWPMPPWFDVSWSLPVEEWFYLSFSAFAVALSLLVGRCAIPIVCLAFIVAPIALRLAIAPPDGNLDLLVRKITIFRLDSMAYGVLVVWWCRAWPAQCHRLRWPALALGAATTLGAVYAYPGETDPWRFSVLLALIPSGFALMLPAAAAWREARGSMSTAIRWLSERSYCIYLIHLTLLGAALREAESGSIPRWLAIEVGLLATFVLADLSYRFFEMPILKRRPTLRTSVVATS
ncbi:MAG: acyltransferase [Bauldia sp.]|nr:acyltransferase [Bauldia sp.]